MTAAGVVDDVSGGGGGGRSPSGDGGRRATRGGRTTTGTERPQTTTTSLSAYSQTKILSKDASIEDGGGVSVMALPVEMTGVPSDVGAAAGCDSDKNRDQNNSGGGKSSVGPVVSIKNARMSYGKGSNREHVLSDLTMTVEKGTIYGLLGASGCGKTTVLSVMVGRRGVSDGRVSVLGGVPGDRRTGVPGSKVGYMPQELALFPEFTIPETLSYFGRLHGMSGAEIERGSETLTQVLDLPPHRNRAIKTLSGGQKRRVSFAAALLHDPELLILDEPTVGVDPVLRQRIWSHLLDLVGERGKTIVITTHYIEEAKQADVVGLLRNGRLLAEDPPQVLLDRYSLTSMEDVFLRLSTDDDASERIKSKASSISYLDNWGSSYRTISSGGTLGRLSLVSATLRRGSFGPAGMSMSGSSSSTGPGEDTLRRNMSRSIVYPGITAMGNDCGIQPISYYKKTEAELTEFQKIKRRLSMKKNPSSSNYYLHDPPCCQCTMPSMTNIWALMIKNFIKLKRNISALIFIFLLPAIQVTFFCAAVGRDPTDLRVAVVNEEFSDNVFGPSSECAWPSGCEFDFLSCRLFDSVFRNDSGLVRMDYANHATAMAAAENGDVWGVVRAPANFSQSLLKRLASAMDASNDTLSQSSVNVHLDMSNQQVAFALKRAFADGWKDFFRSLLSDCEFPAEAADIPVVFDDPVYGEQTPNFTDFMAPGIIILITYFSAMALTGEVFILERKDGLIDRSWVNGVLPSEMVISYLALQFVVICLQAAVTLVFTLAVFGVTCNGPVGALVGLTLLQGTAGMAYGLLLASIFDELTTTMQAGVGSFYPNMLLCGFLWPVEGMPWYLRDLAMYLPCTAACQAMRDIMLRGWDISRPSVYLGFVSTSVWIAIFVLLCYIALRIREK